MTHVDLKNPGSRTPNATDARMLRSRAALNSALLELIALRPLEQITVREIAAHAGVGYATFFRHYESREALLEDVAVDQVHQLVATSLSALDQIDSRAACLALCGYVDEHRAIWSALLTSGAQKAVRDEFVRVSMKVAATRSSGWIPARWASSSRSVPRSRSCPGGCARPTRSRWSRSPGCWTG